MIRYPRLAIGTLPASDVQLPRNESLLTSALLAWLTARGCSIQHFSSRCCHGCTRPAAISGQASRHLDTWLMTAELCRACFVRGFGSSDGAVIDGEFDAPAGQGTTLGGSFDTLCHWLDVPRLAVIDVDMVRHQGLPARPNADGVLLENVHGSDDFSKWRQAIQSAWGLRTYGGLGHLPALRTALRNLTKNGTTPESVYAELASAFDAYADAPGLEELAYRRDLNASAYAVEEPVEAVSFVRSNHVATHPGKSYRQPVIAVAYDDVFHGYFPEMLDMLEALGAKVVDFSPLRDEQVPHDADVVYLGCGNTPQHAAALAENFCLMNSLRQHLCLGKRIYADGGGLLYLAHFCETSDGTRIPMAGILPVSGKARPTSARPRAVEVTLAHDTWLGRSGTKLRGYVNDYWTIEPIDPLPGYLVEPEHRYDLVGRGLAVGSRLQLNFATQTDLLRGFVAPSRVLI